MVADFQDEFEKIYIRSTKSSVSKAKTVKV